MAFTIFILFKMAALMSMRRALLAARRPSLRCFQPIQIEGLRACRVNQAFQNCLFQSKTFSSETSTDPAAIEDQVQERRQRPRRDRDQNAARRRGAKNPFASKENFLERFRNVIEKGTLIILMTFLDFSLRSTYLALHDQHKFIIY